MANSISINTQSSVKVTGDGLTIYFDPLELKDQPHDADVVFITHGHYDHFSPDDIKKVSKGGTVYVMPENIKAEAVSKGLPPELIQTVVPGGAYEAGGVKFETVPAYNVDKRFHPKTEKWVGYVVNIGGERIYVAGDTDALKENESIKCDTAIVPIGGTFTMTASEAAVYVNAIRPKTAIPSHYGSIVGDKKTAGETFARNVAPGIEVKILL